MRQNSGIFILYLLIIIICKDSLGQQNHTLYFLHQVPQSNFLNPAIQNKCKVYIGLPVISGTHLNLAHNGFTFNHLFEEQSSGSYSIDASGVAAKIAGRNYFMSEIYANLFVIGINLNKYYFTFGIRERDDLAVFYTRNIFSLLYKGNTQYEGQWISVKGNGINFNHFREFSISASNEVNEYLTYGFRAKLLFGKLNLITTKMNTGLFTEPVTLNLVLDNDIGIDASLPRTLEENTNNNLRPADNNNSASSIIFNRKNWGLGLDAGFIYKYDDRLTFSGSVLDFGFIPYRSNLTNYSVEGSYTYTGPMSDTVITDTYLRDLFDRINENNETSIGHNSYWYFLSPRIYLGVSRKVNNKLSVNVLAAAKFYKQKILTGLTLSGNYYFTGQVAAALSWSYFHRSINNLGAGIMLGRNPLQFYIVSDNIPGLIWPQSTKNINLCFGLNINLGCAKNPNADGSGCYWTKKADEKDKKMRKLLKR